MDQMRVSFFVFHTAFTDLFYPYFSSAMHQIPQNSRFSLVAFFTDIYLMMRNSGRQEAVSPVHTWHIIAVWSEVSVDSASGGPCFMFHIITDGVFE